MAHNAGCRDPVALCECAAAGGPARGRRRVMAGTCAWQPMHCLSRNVFAWLEAVEYGVSDCADA